MYKILLGFVIVVSISSACSVKSGHLRLDMPGAEIGVDTGGASGSTHCPPGQAKKGRC